MSWNYFPEIVINLKVVFGGFSWKLYTFFILSVIIYIYYFSLFDTEIFVYTLTLSLTKQVSTSNINKQLHLEKQMANT